MTKHVSQSAKYSADRNMISRVLQIEIKTEIQLL